MKLPLAILAAACAIAPVAHGQEQAPPKKLPPKTQAPVPTKGAPQQAPQVGPASNTGGSNRPLVSPNDNCASARVISGPGWFAYDTNGANTDGPAACGIFTADVWYNWTAASTGTMRVDLCSGGSTNTDTEVAVYDTAACVGPLLACNDDFCGRISSLTFNATSGYVYKIRIGGYNGHTGSGTFKVTAAPPRPANDLCSAPTVIAGSGPFPWSNLSAATDGGAESCGFPNQDVWYLWTAPSTSNYVVSLCGATSTDTVLAVYAGAGCPVAGSAIACDDDLCSFAGPSQATFSATSGSVYMIRIGGYNAAEGSGTFTIAPPPPPPANDDCASATAISGGGPFAFDTVGANTDGPVACGLFTADVWYNWTAGASGTFDVSLCGGAGFDTEVAVYSTSACVGARLACNDDFCVLVSKTSFTAVSGSVYKIRIGGYNAAEGSGTFTIAPPPPPPANDDCATPAQIGPGGTGYDNTAATTGSQGQASACGPIDDDLWFTWTATTSGTATVETCFQTASNTMIAVYPGSGCPSAPELGCNDNACGGVTSSVTVPISVGAAYTIQIGSPPGWSGGPGSFTITETQGGGPITPYCFGDGSGTQCPCGNNGQALHGCANSVNPAGARETATGVAHVSADTLVLQGSGMPPNSTTVYFQGTTQVNNGAGSVFGDGLRCTAGTLLRLGSKANDAAGSSGYGGPLGDIPISVRGAIPPAGATRQYQIYYRNPPAFCTSATFNLSNGLEAIWSP